MTIYELQHKKQAHQKITVVTCYDYPSARLLAETSIDAVLVGDSVAMTIHGHPNTLNATIDMMVLHTAAVARGITHQLIISDLPFLCHRVSLSETVHHVQRLCQAGAHAIKIEGGDLDVCATIKHLVQAGVPVIGHIGLTPQSVHQLGGYRVQGKSSEQALILQHQAQQLQDAGCFALVLECIPQQLAQQITQTLAIPTIGIGAGRNTDGQVLVWHDLLGFSDENPYRFVKQYAKTKQIFIDAIHQYITDVTQHHFPSEEHAF